MVKKDLSDKGTVEQRAEGREGGNPVDTSWRMFWAEETQGSSQLASPRSSSLKAQLIFLAASDR